MSYTPSNDVLGRNVQSFEQGDDIQPVSQVIINYGTTDSGVTLSKVYPPTPTVTGRILELTINTITDGETVEDIAEEIYNKYHRASQDDVHESFTICGTELSPLMELGDGVAVNYTSYSDIGNLTVEFSKAMYADVESQGVPDDEDDFPYLSNITTKTERELATIKASIKVTANEIKQEVYGSYAPDYSSSTTYYKNDVVKYTVNGTSHYYKYIYATASSGHLPTDTTYWTDLGTSITIQSLIDLNLNGITISYSSGTGNNSSYIKLNKDGVEIAGGNIKMGSVVADSMTATCMSAIEIDADQITSGTITADYVSASNVGVGTLTLGNSTTNGKINLNNSIYLLGSTNCTLYSSSGDMYLWCAGGNGRYIADGFIRLTTGSSDVVQIQANCLVPYSDGSCGVGWSNYRWGQIYSTSSTINTSDRKEKKDINYNIDNMDSFFDSLKPCSYKFINGTSNRTHYGMISQDIEDSLTSYGMTGLDFAGFCKDIKTEPIYDKDGEVIEDRDTGEYRYGLRYDEFIALCISQIQKLKARVAQLETNAN